MTEQLTFTEAEAKGCADFINFVANRAQWNLSTQEVLQLARHLNFMHGFQTKVDDHIFEHKKTIETKKVKK